MNRTVKIAFLSAILIVSKELLSAIPNIELVTLLLMVYTYTIGTKDSMYVAFIFTTIQALIYPIHTWLITYYIIWPVLILITHTLKKHNASTLTLALSAALFGLCFGAFDSFVMMIIYGFTTFYPVWLRGLPWDLIHGISNYFIVLILFNPVYKNLDKILNKNIH